MRVSLIIECVDTPCSIPTTTTSVPCFIDATALKSFVLFYAYYDHPLPAFMSSNSMTNTSSAASTSTSSGADSSTSSYDPRSAIVGGVLGTLAFILLVGIVLITLRVRRRAKDDGEKAVGPFQGTAVLDKSHPAARIVPFGTPGAEGHYFRKFPSFLMQQISNRCIIGHAPGKSMRLAIRRPDGAWDFTDPSEPFTPTGVSDVQPSPMSSTTNLVSGSRRKNGSRSAILEYKEQESRAAQLIRLGYDARDDDLEVNGLRHPPPAYGSEPTNGPYATYRPPGTRDSSWNASS